MMRLFRDCIASCSLPGKPDGLVHRDKEDQDHLRCTLKRIVPALQRLFSLPIVQSLWSVTFRMDGPGTCEFHRQDSQGGDTCSQIMPRLEAVGGVSKAKYGLACLVCLPSTGIVSSLPWALRFALRLPCLLSRYRSPTEVGSREDFAKMVDDCSFNHCLL
jgi:hypothetical protein